MCKSNLQPFQLAAEYLCRHVRPQADTMSLQCSAEVVHDTDLTSYLFCDGENLYKADYCTAAKDSQALVFPSKETHIVQELALRTETKTGHI